MAEQIVLALLVVVALVLVGLLVIAVRGFLRAIQPAESGGGDDRG